jgi:photosystem II stability/assembly factor-like uncharacterized protein
VLRASLRSTLFLIAFVLVTSSFPAYLVAQTIDVETQTKPGRKPTPKRPPSQKPAHPAQPTEPAAAAGPVQVPSSFFSELKWRLIGPFRGGRALTAVGIPGKPAVYYFGAVGGGVWKSTDAGYSWDPIFDSQPIASIGAIAIAPSDPNIIYVGSGEADMREDITYGNGMYKSTNFGRTWTHIGLTDSQQIGRILVDPHDANLVYVAALGHAFGPNAERGVFRSTDGGQTWTPVLHKDDDTGAIDLAFDPTNSKTIYASLWQTRRPPWNVYPPSNGPGSGLYKSTDGGDHWEQLTNGLPTEGLGRIGIAVSRSEPTRVYAIVDAKDGGLYRSDDAGATWHRMDNERRIWGRGWYFGVVDVDPMNPDIVYVSNTSLYRSTDGGKSFTSFKGAPGGDDYHSIWIAPDDPQRIILSSDQGTTLTLNGGKTWSSWYNQPTGQMYHVATDRRFPYWVYGAQQDSGAIALPSRSDFASITQRDFTPVAVGGESGMLAPDLANPEIVYGGTVTRFDWRNMQSQDISPTITRQGYFRQSWTLPIVASRADPRKLYFAHQMLFRTTDGGKTWSQISGDLTRPNPSTPPNLDPITAKYGLASPRKGVIYTIAPSPLDSKLVWVGTDDGAIRVTPDDGITWNDVTPHELKAWSKVGIIEASHFDKRTAYAAIDRHRVEDMRPYIYRTHDRGTTWHVLGKGIPDGAFVNAVREDTVRRGLLFAGTELGVYVSFDDGDNWQPLQNNLPVVSIRDLEIHGDDLVIATHGRAFWVMDDITPLRQISTKVHDSAAYLFKPADAMRVRPGSDMGTPFPPEIPHGDNPPQGAVLDYYLRADAQSPVELEIIDSRQILVRHYSSADKPQAVDEKTLEFPAFWVKQQPSLSVTAGLHRFVWDLRYTPLPPAGGPGGGGGRRGGGVWVTPGQYTAVLLVNGTPYRQPLTVKMDPRAQASAADLAAQLDASRKASAAAEEIAKALAEAAPIEKQLQLAKAGTSANTSSPNPSNPSVAQFEKQFATIVGPPPAGYGTPVIQVDTDETSLRHLAATFRELLAAMQSADTAPTPEQVRAMEQNRAIMQQTLMQWEALMKNDWPQVRAQLEGSQSAATR